MNSRIEMTGTMNDRVRRPATSSSAEVAKRLGAPAQHGADPRRVVIATLTVVLCLAALVSLTLARAHIAGRVISPQAAKLAASDHLTYYVVDPDAGPTFRIGPSDHSIKLITHLLLPVGAAYEPEQDYAYGIVVILRDLAGQELSRHELNIRSRQSKSGGDRFGWRYENAFMLADERQLTDDRLTRVRLPVANEDRLLELRLVPRVPSSGVRGLARIYARHPRPVDDQGMRELALAPAAGRKLIDHLTYRDWDQLSEDEHRVKLSQVWDRLAAEGEANVHYETLSIYETGFRTSRGTKTDARQLEVERWRSLAVNILGPAELELRVLGNPRTADGLTLYRRGLDGVDVPYPSDGARVRSLTIPPGIHTLFIESARFTKLELEVLEAEAERVWLVEADRAARVDEDGNEVLVPDRRRIEMARVGAQWPEAPRWNVAGPDDTVSRIFRFDVRVAAHFASSWWPNGGPTPTVELCFFDAQRTQLGCEHWEGEASLGSRFESLREGGERTASGEPSTPTGWYVVSDPQTLRVIAPPKTASIELRDPEGGLDQRLLVRGYGYWPEAETSLGEPFQSYESAWVRWRYAPLETRAWFPLRPSNYDALQDSFAITSLHAQVRLEASELAARKALVASGERVTDDPDEYRRLIGGVGGGGSDSDEGWSPGPWTTLEPRGLHRRRSILERLDAEATQRVVGRWDPSLFTQVWTGRTLITDVSATGPQAPVLYWQVDPRTLGRSVRVAIDGQAHTHRIATTRGRWRLPVDDGRRRRIEVEFPAQAGDLTMWINRPVLVGSPPVSRHRTVHELTRALRFPLVKPGVESLTVNLVVYLPRRRDRAELVVEVDGGDPERRTGIVGEYLSVAEHHYTIDTLAAYDEHGRFINTRESTRFVDLDGRPGLPLDAVTVSLTLGEDIVAGRHTVRVKLRDGGRVWVRAFHRGVGTRSSSAGSWTEAMDMAMGELEENEQ